MDASSCAPPRRIQTYFACVHSFFVCDTLCSVNSLETENWAGRRDRRTNSPARGLVNKLLTLLLSPKG
jgi:hypothetical protein